MSLFGSKNWDKSCHCLDILSHTIEHTNFPSYLGYSGYRADETNVYGH